ncbi:hypothetical protein [Pontibacter harenae]|uniref:hypothetical protein n=1 Tax=Pontibacter harenae TaxID=2894083 RepID=UPI001E59592F|nr:hypothetical protein [Pontibacter harenae]MCC9168929.1 hypothetical protein [Pontibacter harenae]
MKKHQLIFLFGRDMIENSNVGQNYCGLGYILIEPYRPKAAARGKEQVSLFIEHESFNRI